MCLHLRHITGLFIFVCPTSRSCFHGTFTIHFPKLEKFNLIKFIHVARELRNYSSFILDKWNYRHSSHSLLLIDFQLVNREMLSAQLQTFLLTFFFPTRVFNAFHDWRKVSFAANVIRKGEEKLYRNRLFYLIWWCAMQKTQASSLRKKIVFHFLLRQVENEGKTWRWNSFSIIF